MAGCAVQIYPSARVLETLVQAIATFRPSTVDPAGRLAHARARGHVLPIVIGAPLEPGALEKAHRLMATFSTQIVVSAIDQASGVLSGIAAKFQNVANSINQNARSIARSAQVAAVAATTAAVQSVAAPLQNFGRDLLRNEIEWSRVQNRTAIATENARELENRSGMRSEAVQAARHAANVRRQTESLALIQKVAKETIYNATQVGEAFAEMNLAGVPEASARAMLPLVAQYGQAADMTMQEAGTSMPRLVRGSFGNQAIADAGRMADLGRFTATAVVAAANVSGANVRQLDEATRTAAPLIMGPERRRLEREAESNAGLRTAAERLNYVETELKKRFINMTAQLATMVQAGHAGSEAGRALAATETRLGALPEKASRVLRTAGLDTMDYQTMAPDSGQRVAGHLERNLPNVSAVARRQIAEVYQNETLTASQRFTEASRILSTRGGANGAALSVQDSLKAVRVLREGHDATVAATDVNGITRELERRGVNPAVFKQAVGQYHAPKIGNMEGAEVDRIRDQTAERVGRNNYLESISEQTMAGLRGAWERLTGAVDAAKKAVWSTFGEGFISLVKSAESAIESVTDKLTARNKDTGEFVNPGLRSIVKWSAIAAGALLVLTPILVTIGIAGLGLLAIGKTFAAIAATAAAVVKGVGAIAAVFLSIPAAIAAVVAAAAGFAIFRDLGGSLAPFMSAVQHVKDALASLWGAMQAVMAGDWTKAGELAMGALRSIGSALWSLGESLGRAALGALSSAWAGIQSWASEVAGRATNLAKNMESDFRAWTDRTGKAIGDSISAAFDSAVSTVSGAFGKLAQAFNDNVVEPIKTAWQSVLDSISGAIDRLVGRITGAIESLRSRLPSWAGGTAGEAQPAAPALPQPPAVSVPQVPLSYNVAPTMPTPDVSALTGAAKAVEGASRDAATPAGTLAENAGKIAAQAAAAASNLDAVSRSLSSLSNMRITLPQISAPQAPAAPAATPAPTPGQQGVVQPFRSFAEQGVEGRPGRVAVSGNVGVDVRVRAEPGSQARTIAQTRGDIRSKIDAGLNDAAFA